MGRMDTDKMQRQWQPRRVGAVSVQSISACGVSEGTGRWARPPGKQPGGNPTSEQS